MAVGIALYVIYRRADETSLLRRVTVRRQVLRAEQAPERDYGSILVPLFGTDSRRRHRADRRAAGVRRADRRGGDRRGHDRGAVGVRDADVAAARRAAAGRRRSSTPARCSRAPRRWGRSTPACRSRRRPCARAAPGYAIVDEARRRGVEAIVLGAEEPSLIRGGARLGGRGGPLEGFVGDVTKYVVAQGDLPRDRDRAPAAASTARRSRPAGGPEAGRLDRLICASMLIVSACSS